MRTRKCATFLMGIAVVLVEVHLDQPDHATLSANNRSRFLSIVRILVENALSIIANELGSALAQTRCADIAILQASFVSSHEGDNVRVKAGTSRNEIDEQ